MTRRVIVHNHFPPKPARDAGKTYYAKLRKDGETKTVTLTPQPGKYNNPSDQAKAENPGWTIVEVGSRSQDVQYSSEKHAKEIGESG